MLAEDKDSTQLSPSADDTNSTGLPLFGQYNEDDYSLHLGT